VDLGDGAVKPWVSAIVHQGKGRERALGGNGGEQRAKKGNKAICANKEKRKIAFVFIRVVFEGGF